MAVSLKHNFVSAVSDGGDSNLVQPSNWNEEHVLTLGASKILGRYTGTTGAAQEITPSTGLNLDSGTGNLTVTIGTDVQAYDADLTGIASATFSSNQVPISNGSSTWSGITVTNFAQDLLDDSNQATMQGTLGLVPGTDVQAYDATLNSIASLGTAADKLAYTTGVDTWAETAITSFGRSLIDDADAAAARTTLGAASVANYTTTVEGSGGTSDWTQATGSDPWIATMTVSGILSTDVPIVDIDLSSVTYADVSDVQADWALVYRVDASANDEIKLYATEQPTENFDIQIQVVR